MTRIAAILLALLAPSAAQAQGYVDASLGAAWRDLESEPPYDASGLEYDTGKLARLEVGTHYDSGLLLRLGYAYTAYDELTALGSLTVLEDVEQQEIRFGVFQATPRRAPLGWRLGAGYIYVDEDSDTGGDYQRGGFVEAAAIVATGKRVTLDFAAALMKLGGPDDFDAEGGELRAVAAFHARAMDFTLGARYALIERDSFPPDERLLELRAGVVFPWAYPEGATY